MVIIKPTDDPDKYELEDDMVSWMKSPKHVTAREAAYLDMIQSVFKVEDAAGNWIPKRLCPHQVIFHISDVALKQDKAPIRVVKKSRNTSFTVDSVESSLMAQGTFSNVIEPFVRLNAKSASDLMTQAKRIIKHMTPIMYEEPDETKRISPDIEPPKIKIYMPFNPKKTNLDNYGSITFPNGCQWRGFPANADASETIRGLRLRGSGGMIDESNFMRSFNNIFIAMRDASAGALNGKKVHQLTIGSTLKGETPFSQWLDDISSSSSKRIVVYDWPVFDRDEFAPYLSGDCDIPFHENDKLISIVPWHDKKELWETWLQDEHVFKEEYMAIKVDSDEQFYTMSLILSATEDDLYVNIDEWENKLQYKYSKVQVGIDVASVHDYFVITCFGLTFEDNWEQFYLTYRNKVDLAEMEQETRGMLKQLIRTGLTWNLNIDANGIGLMITQNLQREFGDDKIRGIKGGYIKDIDGNSHKLNEYGHTKLKRLLIDNKIKMINDEMLIKHFAGWNYDFKCVSTGDGHGDIAMACLYCMLLDDGGSVGETRLYSSSEGKVNPNNKDQWFMRDFKKRLKGHKRVQR